MAQTMDDFTGAWKPNGKVRHSIWCHKCKSESGLTNDELRYARKDMNCKNCGKICVRVPQRVDFLDLTTEVIN